MGGDWLVLFTDGSKMDARVGVGVTGPRLRIYKALGNTLPMYQTEMRAIETCTQKISKEAREV